MGIASMILGVMGVVAWIIPFVGFPINIIGLILGIVGIKPTAANRGMATAGVVMCSIGLVLTILNSIAGFILFSGL